MSVNIPHPAPANVSPREPRVPVAPSLDHERLDVYRVALDFHAQATELVPRRGFRVLRDQLERASLSIVLCVAEGAGRTAGNDKRRFYGMARGSATECGALLDVLHVRGLGEAVRHAQARNSVVRLVQMLSRLSAPPR